MPPDAAYLNVASSQIRDSVYRGGAVHQQPEQLIERQVPNVPEPAYSKPTDQQFFVYDSVTGAPRPNAAFLKVHFFREGRLTEEQALFILSQMTEVLSKEPNLLEVSGPITVCGDIHGQYYDLMKLFEIGGSLEDGSYLFLGDYVDRGCFGIECLLYLFALKLCYPSRISLLRGNHECRHLTGYFTFHRECLRKYSATVYEACILAFNALPLAAILDDRFFCVHGGLSPSLIELSDLNDIDRFQEPPQHGLLCDLLWSDPVWNFGREDENIPEGPALAPGTSFLPNPTRGCSFFFTYEATCNFLERNNLLGVIRGHEAQNQGYAMQRKTPTKKFPSVITIFSAPNYCDVYHNRGAILKYANKNITIRQFNSSSHPYWLPNFIDAFTWSLPFVGAKITDMLLAILFCCTREELEESSEEEEDAMTLADEQVDQEAVQERRQQIKAKILAVGRMQRVFQLLRDEAENASELNNSAMEASGMAAVRARAGRDELGVQGNQIRRSIRNFADARRSDIINERVPEFHEPTNEEEAAARSMFPAVQAPSTRVHRGTSPDGEDTMESIIRRTIENDDDEIQDLAERVARSRRPTRPKGLKRFETATF